MVISHDAYSRFEIPNLTKCSKEKLHWFNFYETFPLKNTSENHQEFSKCFVKPRTSVCIIHKHFIATVTTA